MAQVRGHRGPHEVYCFPLGQTTGEGYKLWGEKGGEYGGGVEEGEEGCVGMGEGGSAGLGVCVCGGGGRGRPVGSIF